MSVCYCRWIMIVGFYCWIMSGCWIMIGDPVNYVSAQFMHGLSPNPQTEEFICLEPCRNEGKKKH